MIDFYQLRPLAGRPAPELETATLAAGLASAIAWMRVRGITPLTEREKPWRDNPAKDNPAKDNPK